jgi:hypothetical protein
MITAASVIGSTSFYSDERFASESDRAWQAFQGRYIELAQTFGIAIRSIVTILPRQTV